MSARKTKLPVVGRCAGCDGPSETRQCPKCKLFGFGAAADDSAKAPLAPKTAFDAAHGSARSLAASIAAALFTSGDGKKAVRLVFKLESGDEWGGWSEAAIATQIEKILSAQNDQALAPTEALKPKSEEK